MTDQPQARSGGVGIADSTVTARDIVGRDKVTHGDEIHGDKVLGDKKVYISRSDLEELNDYLARAVAAYEARMSQAVLRPPLPEHPYKFLYSFDIEDALIFFGRDVATDEFCKKVLGNRLTVLHARSGAGKTSLLNAGLSPRLIREGRLPVYARAYEDPTLAIKRAIAPPSFGPWPTLLPRLTLHEFLGLACGHLSRQVQELVIILDQFEEFFIFWPGRDHRQPFIDALADCYRDKALPVRIIIALRKDYYSDLADFQGRIPTILYNEYRLDTMTREQAQEAITGPVAKLGYPVDYEQVLLDTLLDDLFRGGMELPHLQIICARLYETLTESKTSITLDAYKALGQAKGVLSGYLNNVLDRLPGVGGDVAKAVLKELVSSEATKRVLSYNALASRVEAEQSELDSVLARLVDARLLHRDEVVGEVTYDMAHEYLIEEIKTWIDQADLAFKQAEELLAREVANWRVYGTLIPEDRLRLLHSQREQFRGLDNGAIECLLLSVLQADFAVEDWVELFGEASEKPLLVALNNSHMGVRQAATRGLGVIWGLPEVSRLGDEDRDVRQGATEALGKLGDPRAVEPLIAALLDEDWNVRWLATEALGKLGEPAVEPLVAVLQNEDKDMRQAATRGLGVIWGLPEVSRLGDEDRDVRQGATEALGELGDPRAVEPLIAALQDESKDVRWGATEALGKLGEPAVEPLIAALHDENENVRQGATEALGELGEPRAVEPLITALHDEDKNVRQGAIEALGRLGDPQAIEPLIAALQDENEDMRWMTTSALVQIGEPAVEPLIAALQDENEYVRQGATEALAKLGDPRAVEPLIAALQDENAYVRQGATEALGILGDPRSVEPLIAALQDESKDVRWGATEALGKLGELAVEPLIAALQDESKDVRWGATLVLGKFGDPRAVEPLIAALQDEDKDIRQAATRGLGVIWGLPEVSRLGDENRDVRWMATEALGQLGDPRAVEPLIITLQDENEYVRQRATEALKKIGTPEALAAVRKATS